MGRINEKGFTLLELILVAAILGLMASMTLITYEGSQKRSRDTGRRSDLNQYRVSLESYGGNHNGLYLVQTVAVPAATTLCTGLGFSTGDCPSDVKDGVSVCDDGNTCGYWYQSNANGTGYILWAALEQPDVSGRVWVVCSSGKSGETAQGKVPPVTAGDCPL